MLHNTSGDKPAVMKDREHEGINANPKRREGGMCLHNCNNQDGQAETRLQVRDIVAPRQNTPIIIN